MMKPIERSEVLGLADYETVRERFRARVIEEKKHRRVPLGPNVTVLFENRDTVLLQIQEMLRTERITRPAAVEHEIQTYNELVPGEDELSCTLMIEIPDTNARDAFLRDARGIERHFCLVAGGRAIAARTSERDAESLAADRTTAVHYVKFSLPKEVADGLRAARAGTATVPVLELRLDHPAYRASAQLLPPVVAALGEDLEP
jgi:hypothetical protein